MSYVKLHVCIFYNRRYIITMKNYIYSKFSLKNSYDIGMWDVPTYLIKAVAGNY